MIRCLLINVDLDDKCEHCHATVSDIKTTLSIKTKTTVASVPCIVADSMDPGQMQLAARTPHRSSSALMFCDLTAD